MCLTARSAVSRRDILRHVVGLDTCVLRKLKFPRGFTLALYSHPLTRLTETKSLCPTLVA